MAAAAVQTASSGRATRREAPFSAGRPIISCISKLFARCLCSSSAGALSGRRRIARRDEAAWHAGAGGPGSGWRLSHCGAALLLLLLLDHASYINVTCDNPTASNRRRQARPWPTRSLACRARGLHLAQELVSSTLAAAEKGGATTNQSANGKIKRRERQDLLS
jgi:hypothetical protein